MRSIDANIIFCSEYDTFKSFRYSVQKKYNEGKKEWNFHRNYNGIINSKKQKIEKLYQKLKASSTEKKMPMFHHGNTNKLSITIDKK